MGEMRSVLCDASTVHPENYARDLCLDVNGFHPEISTTSFIMFIIIIQVYEMIYDVTTPT